jgi:hypothetical protein
MDELTKQQLMVGVIFFNVVLMGYMIYWYFFTVVANVSFAQVFTHLAIGAGIAIIPGIVGYFVGRMMYK